MLKLLLDEHISPVVADGLHHRNRQLVVFCMTEWEGGEFLLGLTLVTYDRRTIPPLLKTWGEEGRKHGGVIFVDEKTVSPSDTGGLIGGLSDLWRKTSKWDWTNRVYFLRG